MEANTSRDALRPSKVDGEMPSRVIGASVTRIFGGMRSTMALSPRTNNETTIGSPVRENGTSMRPGATSRFVTRRTEAVTVSFRLERTP